MKNLIKKTHTETKLIYKTSPTAHWIAILIIALCFLGGTGFLINALPCIESATVIITLLAWSLGGILLFLLNTTTWYFNKQTDLVMITRQYLVYKRTKVTRYKLSEIEKIYWQKERVSHGNKSSLKKSYNYFVYVKFKTKAEQFIVSMSKQPAIDSVKELNDFLQIEESEESN